MRSPAAAIAWEFRRRHHWGLIAVAGCLVVAAAIKLLIFGSQRVNFDDTESFALVVIVPLTAMFLYFLAVFSFGLAGDLAARQSMYPARMFTLPMTTAALAGWPMLFGTAAMALLWFATRLLGVWPSGIAVPVIWPALLAASLLAWTQALTWMPYPARGLRVIITVLWLAVIDAVVMVALELKASEAVMLVILAPHVPLAYLTARSAIARARRGDVADWRTSPERLRRGQETFSSSGSAQAWFEWRQHGRSLPALTAILLPFELALLFIFKDTPAIVFETLAGVLLTPPLMAIFAAATVGDSHGLTPFIATRPLSNAALIAAKLRTTIRSTLAAWLLVVIAVPVALQLSGTSTLVMDWIREGIKVMGMRREVVLALLVFFALLASTWKQLVQSLYVRLSGREWLIKASVFLPLSVLAVAFPLSHFVLRSRVAIAALWNSFPWMLALLVCLKSAAAAWVAVQLRATRLLSDRTLILGALCWNAAVFALYALLAWLLPALLFRRYFLVLVAILAVPLARLSAAPLAVAWNRHR
jgi:hypothetical protein